MSAYMLRWEDFDVLGAAAKEYGLAPCAEDAARTLHAENLRSVTYRYPDDLPWEVPGPSDQNGRPYPWQEAEVPSAEEVLALAKSCEYQASECPDYKETAAALLLGLLIVEAGARAEAVRRLIPPPPPAVYASAKESAVMLRAVLRQRFPGVRFRLVGERGTASGWYRLSWEDGPTTQAVEEAAVGFEGATFDGMTDSYVTLPGLLPDGRRTGIRSLSISRYLSPAYWAQLREAVGAALHWPRETWPTVDQLEEGDYRYRSHVWPGWELLVREYIAHNGLQPGTVSDVA